MLKIDVSQIKSISTLPRNYNALVKDAEEKGAIVFLKRNKPISVLLSFSDWQDLEIIRREREENEALRTIAASEKEYKEGKAKTLRSLKDLK